MEYEKRQDPSLYPTAPPPAYSPVQSPHGQGAPYNYPPPGAPYPPGDPGYPPAGGYGAYPGPYPGQQPPMVVMLPTVQPVYPVVVGQPAMVSMVGAIVLSCFVFWCCGMLFGLVAFILAMIGQSSSSSGNTASAIQLRTASYALSVVGIVLGVVIIIVMFTMGRR